MDVPTTQYLSRTELLSKAMRDIRRKRGLKTSEIARRMGMALRSYEHFEAGRGRISYERLLAFAEATDSDPYALLAVVAFDSPEFALRAADNKLMQVVMLTLREFNEELGDDIAYLETRTLIAAFTRIATELTEHVRKRDTFAEEWLAERTAPKPARSPGRRSR